MSTYTKGTQPLDAVRGRLFEVPLLWKAPDGSAINITGFAISASLTFKRGSVAMVPSIISAAAGSFKVASASPIPDSFPLGVLSELSIKIVDAAGATHDFDIPINGIDP